jgi:TolA-binding protein
MALAGSVEAAPPQSAKAPNPETAGYTNVGGPPGVPGSGVPRTPSRPDPARLRAPMPERARNPAEEAALGELERMTQSFIAVSEETEATLRELMVVEAMTGRARLAEHYSQRIRDHEANSRKLRSKAVARYEDFIKQHPDDPIWTPEILFRLAELQFEGSAERQRRREDAWEREVAALEERVAGGETIEDYPEAPRPEHADAVAMFRRVAGEFPRYQHADAARYMMGILLYEEEQYDAARQAFLSLTCADRYPVPSADQANVVRSVDIMRGDYTGCAPARGESKYLAEAWLRIGEIHYDVDELNPALEAYAAASVDTENPLYHAALIRLAWTLYLKRDFATAVQKFDTFIRYADSVRGTPREAGALEFRDDAVRYLAKSYLEEDWDRDGSADAFVGLARLDRDYAARFNEPHVAEIFVALGDLRAEETEFLEAIDIWAESLQRWPLARRAPDTMNKLMQAYSSLQEKELALAARDALATSYLKGTPWFAANEMDTEAVEGAMKLAEDALVATAVDHHARAQMLRQNEDPGALAEYQIASAAYAAYLERFPETQSSYEYRYQYADTLYYSGQLLDAAANFAVVRDSNIDNRLEFDSAESTILSLEAFIEQETAAQRFVLPEMPKDGDPGPWEETALPPLIGDLQLAYDRLLQIRPDAEGAGTFAYKAGELSQRYNRFDEAELRFVAVLDSYCGENVAINAGKAIIDAHVVRGDLAGTREWTDQLSERGCGAGEAGAKFAGELKTIGNAVRFQEASDLFEGGSFEAAADRYVALVNEAPDDPNADRALNNAAVSYEKIGRFSSASMTYRRIFSKYPDSEFADDALARTGLNHARFFEFDEAVKAYKTLAEDMRYEDSEFRQVALKNAASLLDNLQDYGESASLYRVYADRADTELERAEAMFEAAEVTQKTGNHKRTISTYKAYLDEFQGEPGEGERTARAWLAIGTEYTELGERRKAESALSTAVAQYAAAGLQPATEAADLPAEAQFRLAEFTMEDVLKLNLTGTGKKFEKQAKQLFDKIGMAAQEYDKVFPYRRLEWTLAGMYRRGFAFETVARKVRDAPTPKQLKEGTESWFAYKDIVDREMQRYEDKAVALYEETVVRAKQFRISNEWTQRARERLNVYKPEEYPLVRPASLGLQLEDRR